MKNVEPIIIIATWSSGSTALTGFLHHCGAYTCPPHQHTNDERTPHAFEPLPYAKALRHLINEFTLKQQGDFHQFHSFFKNYIDSELQKSKELGFETIALKHPLQTFILPYLKRHLNPKFVFVTRPIDQIEATRVRRRWHPIYGALGAKQIYSVATDFLINNSCPYLSVPYTSLLNDIQMRQALLDFCNLEPNSQMLSDAENFLRK